MKNENIVELDLITKIQYGFFNFFAPISMCTIILLLFKIKGIVAIYISLASILIGMICFVVGHIKYKKFLYADDNKIVICENNPKNPKVVGLVSTSDIDEKNQELIINSTKVEIDNKKITLLNPKTSMLGMLCYTGPFVFIPLFKMQIIQANIYKKLNGIMKTNTDITFKEPTKSDKIAVNFLMWAFVCFVVFFGTFGIIITPFYAYV